MSKEAAADTIRSRYKTLVADAETLPTQYDNASFTPPEDSEWSRWTILFGDTTQVSVGATNQYRTAGIAVAQLFVPIETGDERAMQLADVVFTSFKPVTVNGVVFRTPGPPTNEGRDNKWWQYNVNCPFYFDQFV